MNEIIYLEPDEDITGVIARVKKIETAAVSLVIPRGGSIAQSVVNLKLLKREIEKMGKMVSLITKDKISKNLASQVGVTVYSSAQEAKSFKPGEMESEPEQASEKPENVSASGIRINQYSREIADEAQAATGSGAAEVKNMEAEAEIETSSAVLAETEAISNTMHTRELPPIVEDEDEIDQRVEQERASLAHARPIERATIEHHDKDIDGKKALPKKNISSRRKPAIIIISFLLAILLLATVVVYPSAIAKVTLATSDIDISQEILADKNLEAVNLENMAIPAKEYIQEGKGEKTFDTTGKKDVGTKASGEITFYNDYDPSNSISLPSGTQLTASGKVFVLDAAITIPTATIISLYPLKTTPGQVKGLVTARENGDSYNIAASTFSINSFSGTKKEKVYGQSTVALTGGTTKEIRVVSDEDLANAKKSISDELAAAAKEALLKSAETDQMKLIASSIATTEGELSSTKLSGEESDNFAVKFSVKLTELAFNETSLRECAIKKIEAGLKSNEMLVNPNGTDITYDVLSVDNVKGTAKFSSKFIGKIGNKVEVSSIQDILVRAKYGSAESKIKAISGVKEAQISIKPGFWPLLPFLKQRISVSFDYEKE